MRKTKDVEIFGKKVTLSERNAQDVLKLVNYASNTTADAHSTILINASVVADSLKASCGWFKWHFYFKWRYNTRRLMKILTPREIIELSGSVSELDGNKKKVADKGKELDGMSQDA